MGKLISWTHLNELEHVLVLERGRLYFWPDQAEEEAGRHDAAGVDQRVVRLAALDISQKPTNIQFQIHCIHLPNLIQDDLIPPPARWLLALEAVDSLLAKLSHRQSVGNGLAHVLSCSLTYGKSALD